MSIAGIRHVRKISKSDHELSHVCPSARNNSAPAGRIFMKFDIRGFFFFFGKSVEKIQVASKSGKKKGNLHGHQYTFSIISRSVILRMKIFQKTKRL